MKIVYACIFTIFFLMSCTSSPPTETAESTQTSTATMSSHMPNYVTTTPQPRPVAPKDLVIATAQALNPECEFPAYNSIDLFHDLSPSKNWVVLNCEGDVPKAILIDLKGGQSWIVRSYEYLSAGNRDIKMRGYRWTKDGNYVYLETHVCCSDGPTFYNGWGLIRLNLKTGKYSAILQPSFPDTVYSFSVSPNDRLLVYVNSNQNRVAHIVDLASENERTIRFEQNYTDIGDFVWTNGSDQILIVAGLDGWRNQKAGFSLFLYDMSTGVLRLLVDDDHRQPNPPIYDYERAGKSLWLSDKTIVLYSLDGQLILNIQSGQLIPFIQLTATP